MMRVMCSHGAVFVLATIRCYAIMAAIFCGRSSLCHARVAAIRQTVTHVIHATQTSTPFDFALVNDLSIFNRSASIDRRGNHLIIQLSALLTFLSDV